MPNQRLEYLFFAFFNRTATPEERIEFLDLLKDPLSESLVKGLMSQAWDSMHSSKIIFTDIESEKMIKDILESENSKPTQTFLEPAAQKNETKRRFLISQLIAAATLTIIFLVVAFYFLNRKPDTSFSTKQSSLTINNRDKVVPGSTKAVLIMDNGSHIVLDSVKDGSLTVGDNREIIKVNGKVFYNNKQLNDENIIAYNTIVTPVGGQYQIELSDGTKVWLNAASSLRFPVSFKGGNRTVELTGEAFFDVHRNTKQPFIVKTKEGLDVEVLGTTFNIMAYNDEADLVTTLVEGSVNIHRNNERIKMLPNEQVILLKNINDIKKIEADVQEAIAWKEGIFYFNDDDITSIMRKLARWYNIEVVYKNNIPLGHYTGAIKRQSEISKVFELLELPGGIKFEMSGRKVTVALK